MNILTVFLLINGILCETISLFARSVNDGSKLPLATVNTETKLMVMENELNGEYCIGTEDINDHECFSYFNGHMALLGVNLFLDKQGNVNSIALLSSGVNLVKFVDGAKPNLNPVNRKKPENRPKVEKITKTIIVKDENGEEVEKQVEEEIDNRSFIQKNWVYIVIPLIFFLLAGEKES